MILEIVEAFKNKGYEFPRPHEENRREYIDYIKICNAAPHPVNRVMFEKLAVESAFCEEFLSTVLEMPDLETVKYLYGDSDVIDVLCRKNAGEYINASIRMNGCKNTGSEEKFINSFDIYLVTIMETDTFGAGHAVYHIGTVDRRTGLRLDDGFHEMYVNSAVMDGSDAARLMLLFTAADVYSEKFLESTRIKRRCLLEGTEMDEKREEILNGIYTGLIADGRMDDLKRAVSNREYRNELVWEYIAGKYTQTEVYNEKNNKESVQSVGKEAAQDNKGSERKTY